MIWVHETKNNLILVTSLRNNKILVLDDYRVSFVMITDTWLVSLDCLNNNNDEI